MKNVKVSPLKIARVLKGFTQTGLSYRVKIPQPYIANFEAGRWLPNERQVNKLARALGTTPEQIFPKIR